MRSQWLKEVSRIVVKLGTGVLTDSRKQPDLTQMEQLVSQLGSEILQGKKIAIHCRQGVGLSSLVSTALLISAGEDIEQALQAISKARGLEVPETVEQRKWLDQFAKTHSSPSLARDNR